MGVWPAFLIRAGVGSQVGKYHLSTEHPACGVLWGRRWWHDVLELQDVLRGHGGDGMLAGLADLLFQP